MSSEKCMRCGEQQHSESGDIELNRADLCDFCQEREDKARLEMAEFFGDFDYTMN